MLTVAQRPLDWAGSGVQPWLAAAGLIVITTLLGPSIGSGIRYPFLACAFFIGIYAWRWSPGEHLKAVLVLFAFTPFARRMVDLSAGYDYAGVMIAGPLLALLAPIQNAHAALSSARIRDPRLAPYFVIGACVIYAVILSVLGGDYMPAASGALKWAAPILYGIFLFLARPDPNVLLDDMTKVLGWILPVMGVYGVYQYIDPPLWDRYWLAIASITSAGTPEPFQVRTFSTMHAPAAFATYTGAGLLLVAFLSRGAMIRVAMIPAAVALLLSLYRTAWLALIASVIFCLLYAPTRRKAGLAVAVAIAIIAAALAFLPFADVIGDRLTTLTDPSNDASGQERVGQFFALYGRSDSSFIGNGFSNVDVGVAGAEAVDGTIIACWTSMGIVAGLICLAATFAMLFTAISRASANGSLHSIVLSALLIGFLVQIPLATIISGEIGFLFFTIATLAMCCGERTTA